jgi:CheY-like chemotaxis protein
MTDQIDFKSKRALVIDDFPGMRTAFKAALASFGMSKVDLAASGDEALMRVKNTKYDIIISDYNLGDAKDGQQVLEEMRHRKLINLGTVYLMVTAESVYERVVAAAELAPDDYLIKPFNGEILRNRLEAILFKKQAFREVHKSFASGDLERALSECNLVIKTNPKCLVDAMRLKGEILISMGDLQGAGELYSEISAMRAVPSLRSVTARRFWPLPMARARHDVPSNHHVAPLLPTA